MNMNVGSTDRITRALIGLLLIIAPLVTPVNEFASPTVFWAAIAIGAVMVLTSVSGVCFVYKLLGKDTTASS